MFLSKGSMLHGYRILIIHTEPLIGECLADALRAEGAEIVGPARGLKHAFECAEAVDLRLAVLNFIFEGGNTLPIAEHLHRRRIPIVFFTAMDREFMVRATTHLNATILANPADIGRIVPVIEQLIGHT
jgi:DNA-binding response OmpR family regulator